jgi:beta-galactosidase
VRRKKRNILILFPTILFSLFVSGQNISISLNNNWQFSLADIRSDKIQSNIQWQEINLPHTWNAQDVIDETPGYRRGIAFYRKFILYDRSWDKRKIILHFNGIAVKAEVYLNNILIKAHLGAYTAFDVDITDNLLINQPNELLIKVDNSVSLGEIVPPVSGDFSMFGGIYRSVYLEIINKIHFENETFANTGIMATTPHVSTENATMQITGTIYNESLKTENLILKNTLEDRTGSEITSSKQKIKVGKGQKYPFIVNLNIIKPQLWSPESPYLYRLCSEIINEKTGVVQQKIFNSVGFRWFSVDKTGFYLNGEKIKLHGAARHQDYVGIGNAIPLEINRNDMMQLKEMGANFVRISHYPQDPEIYRSCDELGLIVWSEIPIVNEVKPNETFANNCKTMFKEMLYQQYNHPSVIMWGAMNELWNYNRQAIKLAHELDSIQKKIDPLRLSCVAFHAALNEKPYTQNTQEMFNISDINGFNVYEAWYSGDSSTIEPTFLRLKKFSLKKPLFLSEFGAGSDQRTHTYTPQIFDFSPEYQQKFIKWYLNFLEKEDSIIGCSIWNLIDFQVDGRIDTQPCINNKGILTADRQKKGIFYYIQARWSNKPMVHIAGSDWTYRVEVCDSSVNNRPVIIYTNQDSVELFLNGKSLGKLNSQDREVCFLVPFINGNNSLIAKAGSQIDNLNIQMEFIPNKLTEYANLSKGIYVNTGQDHCYFFDPLTKRMWLPDQPYKEGSWGYVDGKPFDSWPENKFHDRKRKGVAAAIKNTILEPLFQTFLIGTTCYRFDVPKGEYEVTLYFTEPFNKRERNNFQFSGTENGNRIFNVYINKNLIIDNLDLAKEVGEQTAFVKSAEINTQNGISIELEEISGISLISGISVRKLN